MVMNRKTIVIYESNTGFTRKYAEWIAQELQCEAVPAKKAKEVCLNDYEAVVFGGWLMAGSIQGWKEFREKLTAFSGKKAVFAVGAMPAEAPQAADTLKACFSEEERKSMGTYFLQGGLDYAHMGVVHKLMMKGMSTMLKKQKGADSPEYRLVSQSFDAADKAAIRPLVDYIRQEVL